MREKEKEYDIDMITDRTGCIKGPMLIPFYLLGNSRCVLMDTGSFTMREILERTLTENDLQPSVILCTHTHFDHSGNTAYLAQKYGAEVFLPEGEAEMSRTIAGVKSYLYCYSAGQVRKDRNLSAIPWRADRLIREGEEEVSAAGERFRILHTPGHSIDHISIITPDDVCYAGDALMSGHSLYGSKLPYAFHMQESFRSMAHFRNVTCPFMILAHRSVEQAPYSALAEENLSVMQRDIDELAALIDRQMTTEEIMTAVENTMQIEVSTVEKALFLDRFLRPYLEHLIDTGSHRQSVRNGLLCYEPVQF